MARDNAPPPDEGKKAQARRLAEQALQAEQAGDRDRAEELYQAADQLDPGATADVLEEDDSVVQRHRQSPPRAVPLRAARGFAAKSAPPAVELSAWQARGTAGALRGGATQPTSFAIALQVNDQEYTLTVDARTTLLDALRDRLGLTGTKKGCALGQCGACTVLLDGRAVNACLMLAVMARGKTIRTIEGLAREGALHPVQAAFIRHDAFQCGYCTPGQILAAVALIASGKAETDEGVREGMSGNLCRCGAYVNIVAAIRDAATQEAD